MAYCDFTLSDIKRQLHCSIAATPDLFASGGEVQGSPWLHETLRETLPLALAVHTSRAAPHCSLPHRLLYSANWHNPR